MNRSEFHNGLMTIAGRFARAAPAQERESLLFEIFGALSPEHWFATVDRLTDAAAFPTVGDIRDSAEILRMEFRHSGRIRFDRISVGEPRPYPVFLGPPCLIPDCAYCALRRDIVGVVMRGATPGQIADLLERCSDRFPEIKPEEIADLRLRTDDWQPPPDEPDDDDELPF